MWLVFFIHGLLCLINFYALDLDLAEGIVWLSAPDEHTYVKQGSPFSLHWHYRMDENETFLSSDIEKTVHVKGNANMASRHKGEQMYYIYQREDSLISIFGKNNIRLIVHLAKIGHNITYCCEVVSRSATGKLKDRRCSEVFVYDVPRITYHIPQLSCKQGDSIKLHCNATGIPKPHLDWIHDDSNELIDSSADILLNITGKRSEGRYCCDANNGFGRETACTAVNVTEYEPENTTLLVKLTNRDDVDIIHIECKADASPPSNHFIIYFNGTQYNSSDGLQTIEVRTPRKDKRRHEIAVSCIPCNKYGQGPIMKVILPLYVMTVFNCSTADKGLDQTTQTFSKKSILIVCAVVGLVIVIGAGVVFALITFWRKRKMKVRKDAEIAIPIYEDPYQDPIDAVVPKREGSQITVEECLKPKREVCIPMNTATTNPHPEEEDSHHESVEQISQGSVTSAI